MLNYNVLTGFLSWTWLYETIEHSDFFFPEILFFKKNATRRGEIGGLFPMIFLNLLFSSYLSFRDSKWKKLEVKEGEEKKANTVKNIKNRKQKQILKL